MTLEEILEKLHSPTEHAITLENGELTALLEELKELREESESLSAQVLDLQLAYNNELADGKKAKRLLKAAVATFNDASCNKDCRYDYGEKKFITAPGLWERFERIAEHDIEEMLVKLTKMIKEHVEEEKAWEEQQLANRIIRRK